MINDDEKYYYIAVKNKLEIYSSEQLRSKKESITNEDNCFQNALNDSLDYQKIKKDPQKISKLKPYINQYNWKDIKFPSDKEDWKKFEQNNKEIALNILFVPHNKKEIPHAYISKYNHKRKNQVILLMITDDGERWHYLAVRSMSEEGKNILKYSPGDKSLKVPFIIYADLECLLKKEQSSQNNPKNSYIQRQAKHKPSGYSLSLNCSFDEKKQTQLLQKERLY